MVPSRYLLMLRRSGEERTVLFHALRGAILALNCGIDHAEELCALPSAIVDQLNFEGFLVTPQCDEIKELDQRERDTANRLSTLRLALVTGYNCNLACKYCFVPEVWKGWGRPVPAGSMSNDTIQQVLRFVEVAHEATGFTRLSADFVGLGEPLASRQALMSLLKVLSRFAARTGVTQSFIIVTNGTLLTDEFAAALSPYRPMFQISLDGGPEYHNRQRTDKRGVGTYETIINSLRTLARFELPFSIRINVADQTREDLVGLLEDVYAVARERAPILLSPILPGSIEACQASFTAAASQSVAMSQAMTEVVAHGLTLATPPFYRPLPCYGCAKMSFAIDMFGDLYPCEGLVGNLTARIASLLECGTAAVFAKPDIACEQPCRECSIRPSCGGACPAWHHFGFTRGQCSRDVGVLLDLVKAGLCRCYPDWFDAENIGDWRVIAPPGIPKKGHDHVIS